MRVLVLGGTQFVGWHMVRALAGAGHVVSVLNRGRAGGVLPEGVERLVGDRDRGAGGLAALQGRSWDVCVDVSGYTATHVRASAEVLDGHVGRYVFVSAVSVYGDPRERPVLENHPRVNPAGEDVTEVVGEMYGRLKVTCENIVEEVFGDRAVLLRPQIVAGAHDPYDRFSYWVRRAAEGGAMLAPGDGSDHVQVIDALDVGRFVVRVVEAGLGGTFNLAGPRLTWAEFVRLLGARDVIWVGTEVLQSAGVTEFELPLFRAEHGARSGLMDVSNERAVGAGLEVSRTEETIERVRRWLPACTLSAAMSREREMELIQRARGLAGH